VDSGNLAGHLLTLQPGLLALGDNSILGARWLEGISDTFQVLTDAAKGSLPAPFGPVQQTLEDASRARPATLDAARQCLERLATSAEEGANALSSTDVHRWAQALAQQCRAILDDLLFLVPWLRAPDAPIGAHDVPADLQRLSAIPTLRQLAELEAELVPILQRQLDTDAAIEGPGSDPPHGDTHLASAAHPAAAAPGSPLGSREGRLWLSQMEYDFLYDEPRRLLAIGYNVGERRRDASYYDLLASEARLASFVAIAQGQLPQESWFALGRLLTSAGGKPTCSPGAARCSST
jgi:cyclic beta-1,2-glucan synthetase